MQRESPWSSGLSGLLFVQKVAVKREFEAGLRHSTTGKLCQPSGKCVPLSNSGMIRQLMERDSSTFHQLCPRYSGPLTSTAPTAIRLWETFTFTFYADCRITFMLYPIRL